MPAGSGSEAAILAFLELLWRLSGPGDFETVHVGPSAEQIPVCVCLNVAVPKLLGLMPQLLQIYIGIYAPNLEGRRCQISAVNQVSWFWCLQLIGIPTFSAIG